MHHGFGHTMKGVMTTIDSLVPSKSLLLMRLKRRLASRSRSQDVSFGVGKRYQPDRREVFCRKYNLCFISTVASWSGNPAYSIWGITRDPRSSTWLGTHRYPGGDPQSGCGARANAHTQ